MSSTHHVAPPFPSALSCLCAIRTKTGGDFQSAELGVEFIRFPLSFIHFISMKRIFYYSMEMP